MRCNTSVLLHGCQPLLMSAFNGLSASACSLSPSQAKQHQSVLSAPSDYTHSDVPVGSDSRNLLWSRHTQLLYVISTYTGTEWQIQHHHYSCKHQDRKLLFTAADLA